MICVPTRPRTIVGKSGVIVKRASLTAVSAVIAVGLITTAIEGKKLLEENYCDFVAYGRELLRSPNFAFYAASEFKEKDKINSSYQRAF